MLSYLAPDQPTVQKKYKGRAELTRRRGISSTDSKLMAFQDDARQIIGRRGLFGREILQNFQVDALMRLSYRRISTAPTFSVGKFLKLWMLRGKGFGNIISELGKLAGRGKVSLCA